MSCGPAALLAAVSACDLEAAERLRQMLDDEAPVPGALTSFHDLATWAARVGYEATGLRIESRTLAGVPLPAIAQLQPHHFVVIRSANAERVVVSEQDGRPYSMTRAGFERLFSGNILCLQRRST